MKFVAGIKNIAQAVVNNDVRHGKVHSIDFDRISVVMENTTTVIHNVTVGGDPEKLAPGDRVTLVMVKTKPIAITEDAAQLLAEVAPHAETHGKEGIDPILPEDIGAAAVDHTHAPDPVDDLPIVPSLRSLGIGAQQAAAGNHTHESAGGGNIYQQEYHEVFTATFAQTTYILAYSAVNGSTKLFWNGILQNNGADYMEDDSQTIVTFFSPAAGDIIDIVYMSGSPIAPVDLMANIKTVDGETSGLDADMVDGKHASELGLAKGTAFPSIKAAGDVFFRTDLNLLCTYNGTYWMTVHEYAAEIPYQTISATGHTNPAAARSEYGLRIMRCVYKTNVATTLNASNYYVVETRILSNTYGSAYTAATVSLASDIYNTWTSHETNVTTATNTTYGLIDLNISKIGSPGALTLIGTIYYRLIVS